MRCYDNLTCRLEWYYVTVGEGLENRTQTLGDPKTTYMTCVVASSTLQTGEMLGSYASMEGRNTILHPLEQMHEIMMYNPATIGTSQSVRGDLISGERTSMHFFLKNSNVAVTMAAQILI